MKKTLYYTFLPSKNEEMVAMASNRPYQMTRTLVEIQDYDAVEQQLLPNPNNPWTWKIQKTLENHEATTGKIHLSHNDVFEHVFKHLSLDVAETIEEGNKVRVNVCDVTDQDTPVMYGPNDDQTFFEKGLEDEYVLGLNMAMVRSRGFKKDDKVAIYYEPNTQVFYFFKFP